MKTLPGFAAVALALLVTGGQAPAGAAHQGPRPPAAAAPALDGTTPPAGSSDPTDVLCNPPWGVSSLTSCPIFRSA